MKYRYAYKVEGRADIFWIYGNSREEVEQKMDDMEVEGYTYLYRQPA